MGGLEVGEPERDRICDETNRKLAEKKLKNWRWFSRGGRRGEVEERRRRGQERRVV